QFLRSFEGVKAANNEFSKIVVEVQRQLDELKKAAPGFQLSLKTQQRQFVITGRGPALLVDWNYHYANSLDDAHLEVTLWEGHPPWPGLMSWNKPHEIQRRVFEFDVTPREEYLWIAESKDKKAYSSEGLAEYLLRYTIEQAEKYKDR